MCMEYNNCNIYRMNEYEWAKCDTHFTKKKMVEADKQANKKKIYLKRLYSKRNDLTFGFT